MSKIVVDQIQKSGGPALNLPTASAGVNNSLLVADASQNLSFTTFGNLFPSGLEGQILSTDGSGTLSFVEKPGVVPSDNALMIATVASSSGRGNLYSTGQWTSSGPNSTYQNYQAAGTNTSFTHMSFNMFMGDGHSNGTTQSFFSHDYSGEYDRTIQYATNNRVGDKEKTWFYYDNNSSYGGITWRILPIRNNTASPITTTLNFGYSSYDAYNGAALGVYTPTGTGTLYSEQTDGTWSQLFSASNDTQSTSTASVTIPANTTVLVMLVTSHNYMTTYYFDETSYFYDLGTTFSTGLTCDLRMLNALATVRTPSATNATSAPHEVYTACAAIYGDR